MNILLVSHGTMAKGTYEAAKMIAGGTLNIKYICLSDGKGIEEFQRELDAIKTWMDESDQLFVLADLLGGSPYVTTLSYLEHHNVLHKTKVITGMNLALLLSIMFAQDLDDDAKLNEVINDARNGMKLFEQSTEDTDEEL